MRSARGRRRWVPADRRQRLAYWERVHRSRYADWDETRARVNAALARGDSRRAIMREHGLSYHVVRSLDEQRREALGEWRPPPSPEREISWREVNARLAALIERLLEEGP